MLECLVASLANSRTSALRESALIIPLSLSLSWRAISWLFFAEAEVLLAVLLASCAQLELEMAGKLYSNIKSLQVGHRLKMEAPQSIATVGGTLHHSEQKAIDTEPTLNSEASESDDISHDGSGHPHMSDADLEKTVTQNTSSAHQPATRTVTAQDWSGPDDPENPHNWSLLKRCLHIFPIAFLSFAVTAGSSMITPSTSEIAEAFGVSRTVAILSLSLFVLGLGLGPTIAAPMSETFGRSLVYKVTGLVYMLFILGAGFSKNLGSLLVCRLLAGMAGGPVLAVGAGTNADTFPVHLRAVSSSFYIMAPFLGPSLGSYSNPLPEVHLARS